MLPEPDPRAEDAFVQSWMESKDLEGLIDAVTVALDARRPLLAARLVGLLEGRVDFEPGSDLERASRAAQFLLVNPKAQHAFDDFTDAWRSARRSKVNRIKQQQRLRMRGKQHTVSRLGRNPRKR